jgi:predicted outer membrane repeat protein
MAGAGDTIQIEVEGVLALDSVLLPQDTIHIFGPGPDRFFLDGQNNTVIFDIQENTGIDIRGVTLENGNADGYPPFGVGGAVITFSYFRAENCVFKNNVAVAGGALFFAGSLNRTPSGEFTNCCFYGNRAELPSPLALLKSGGAIHADGLSGGDVRIQATNCTFSNNYALRSGGAVYTVSRGQGDAVFSCTNCTITANEAERFGGGIDNSESNSVILQNSIVSGNSGPLDFEDLYGTVNSEGNNIIGGGLLNFTPQPTDVITLDPQLGPLGDHGSVLFTHVPSCSSPAVDQGNPLFSPELDLRGRSRVGIPDIGSHERDLSVDGKVLNLQDSGANSIREAVFLACPGDTIQFNELAGRIRLSAPLSIAQSVSILGNTVERLSLSGEDSSRVFLIQPDGNLYCRDLTIRNGNSTAFGGGAILNKGEATLDRCAVIYSQAEAGGAIANYGDQDTAKLTLINCTLSGNYASAYAGGAIDNRGFLHAAFLTLTNCTLSDNEALFQGGGIFNDGTTTSNVELVNTILDGNRAEDGPEGYGVFSSLGGNLIGDTSDMSVSLGMGDLLGVSAMLDPLGSWGGPSPTHRIPAGSPAINAGNNAAAPGTDQRGFIRIFDQVVDIGAYEADPATAINQPLSPRVKGMAIFPNPLQEGTTHIRLSASFHGTALLSIFTMKGELLSRIHLDFFAGEAGFPLSPNQYPPGIYQLVIRTTNSVYAAKLRFP